MEFTISLKSESEEKVRFLSALSDNKIHSLSRLLGVGILDHIRLTMGRHWSSLSDARMNDTLLLDLEEYENIRIIRYSNLLEAGSKTMLVNVEDSDVYYLSFSGSSALNMVDVLSKFGLDEDDIQDIYKETNDVLDDLPRERYRSQDSIEANNLQNHIGIYYGNSAARLAIITSGVIKEKFDVDMNILYIGSGDVTYVDYNGKNYELVYEYIYEDERLVSIKLTSYDSDFYSDEIVVPVNDDMRRIYSDVMQATYLLSRFDSDYVLTDEAKAYPDNWNDAI